MSPAPAATAGVAAPELPVWALVMLPLAAVAVVHGEALRGFFAADDIDYLARALGLDPSRWGWARPLSGWFRWELFTTWFGVQPLPHLLLGWTLQLASALLVARIAWRAGLGTRAAAAASVLVASTAIAYTSTRWASAGSEPMAAALALGTLALHLECRRRTRPALAWCAGVCAIGAVAAKESTLLLPVAVWAFDRLVVGRGPGRGALREIIVCGALAGAATVAAWLISPHAAGEAYALDFRPAAVTTNLLTYAAWIARVFDPLRDRAALPQPALAPWGLALLAAWLAAVWAERHHPARTATAGLTWFVLLLAPVLPLARHTYLYYLLAPFAGAALTVGALLVRGTARLPARVGLPALTLLLILAVANEARQARARASYRVGGVLVDRIPRESEQLRHAVTGLRAAGVAAGDTIALMSPFSALPYDLVTGEPAAIDAAGSPHHYVPVVAALRGGEALRVFLPGVTVLGMSTGIPPEWSRARIFRYDNRGHVFDQGRGIEALDSLATDYLLVERFAETRATIARMIALGADGPELRWKLCCALSGLGEDSAATIEARRLVSRWPDSERARLLIAEDAARGAAGPRPR